MTKRVKVEDSFHNQTMLHYNLIIEYEDGDTKQVFMCEIERTQTKDQS